VVTHGVVAGEGTGGAARAPPPGTSLSDSPIMIDIIFALVTLSFDFHLPPRLLDILFNFL